jgi:hypothetical protein
VVDCLFQNQVKEKSFKDTIEGTIGQSKWRWILFNNYLNLVSHFEKFKEHFNNGKMIDFKNEEAACN